MSKREKGLKCLACGEPLTGKQRYWCSEACRSWLKRQNDNDRVSTGNDRESTGFDRVTTGFDRVTTGFDRVSSGNARVFSNKREFRLTFVVMFASSYNPGEWDMGLIDVEIQSKLGQIVQEFLKYEHPDWKIEVRVVSQPKFPKF